MIDIERVNTGLIICIGEDERYSKDLSDKIMQSKDAPNGRNIKLALLEVLLQKGILPRKYTLKGIEVRDMRRSDISDSWIEVRCPFVDMSGMSKADILATRLFGDESLNIHIEADSKAFYESFIYFLECIEKGDKELCVNNLTEPVVIRFTKPK